MTLYPELYSYERCQDIVRLSSILTDFPVCEFDYVQLSIQGIEVDCWIEGTLKKKMFMNSTAVNLKYCGKFYNFIFL
jgi:hypothetical protein